MGQRVLATPEAVQAIQKMQQIIAGELTGQVRQLDTQGRTLSDPNVWDGPKANDFRSQLWPQVNSALRPRPISAAITRAVRKLSLIHISEPTRPY